MKEEISATKRWLNDHEQQSRKVPSDISKVDMLEAHQNAKKSVAHQEFSIDANSSSLQTEVNVITPLDTLAKHVPGDLISEIKGSPSYDSGINSVVFSSYESKDPSENAEDCFDKLNSTLKKAAAELVQKEILMNERVFNPISR